MPTVDPVEPLPALPPVDDPGTPSPVKPGWNTSEFWTMLLNKALIVVAVTIPLMLTEITPGTFAFQALTVAALVLAQFGYTAMRTKLKVAELRAQSDIAVGYLRAQEQQLLAQAERSRLEVARLSR